MFSITSQPFCTSGVLLFYLCKKGFLHIVSENRGILSQFPDAKSRMEDLEKNKKSMKDFDCFLPTSIFKLKYIEWKFSLVTVSGEMVINKSSKLEQQQQNNQQKPFHTNKIKSIQGAGSVKAEGSLTEHAFDDKFWSLIADAVKLWEVLAPNPEPQCQGVGLGWISCVCLRIDLLGLELNKDNNRPWLNYQSVVTSLVPAPSSLPATFSTLQACSDISALHPPALHISCSVLAFPRLHAPLLPQFPLLLHPAQCASVLPSLPQDTLTPAGCSPFFALLPSSLPATANACTLSPVLSPTPYLPPMDCAFGRQQIFLPQICVWAHWPCVPFAGDGTSQSTCACSALTLQLLDTC